MHFYGNILFNKAPFNATKLENQGAKNEIFKHSVKIIVTHRDEFKACFLNRATLHS